MAGQQPHEMFDYTQAPGPSRSPNAARPNGFVAPGFASGMTMPRQSSRPFETLGSAALYGDHLSSAYRTADGMSPNMGGFSANSMAYGFDNSAASAWAYTGNVATVNGAMNGASRPGRPMPRRSALPTTWADPPSMNMHNTQQNSFIPNGINGSHMTPGMIMESGMNNNSMQPAPQQSETEQLIPTAIVIKNIPFAVRKEQLAQIMVEMNLPQPYAFNYHFDNGVFRGLAFANFQNPDDTRSVIERMNGLDVSGRKLRVEYKKMLPEAERERIEREKRERRGQLEEQHRAPMLHQQPSLQSLTAGSNSATRTPNTTSSSMPTLDLNDPKTLNFYTQLTIFKSDESRETLIFPASITPEDRRQIHIIAHHMGLEHQSWGDSPENRQLHIYRRKQMYSPTGPVSANSANVDAHRRGLSRAATFDLSTGDQVRSNPHGNIHRPSPTIEYPVSTEGPGMPNNLRAAKSFADLRSMTPSPSANSTNGYLGNGLTAFATANSSLSRLSEYGTASSAMTTPSPTMHVPSNNSLNGGASIDPTMGLATSMAGLGLSYESISNQHRSNPGAIGSQRPGTRPTPDSASRNAPDRQPRNPEWNEQQGANFANRARTNGHSVRGSDSSDNGSSGLDSNSNGHVH